ncbi:MAG: 3'-5' exonuclease [Myxococcales bacterium]|nr:3'-5' exonuclease [Myxococcales bacterium]
MLKNVKTRVWAFDAEWVPDPLAGCLVYDLPDPAGSPEAVMQAMWQKGGATEEDPTPFLKTVLCRVVSIAALERRVDADGSVALKLTSLPHASEGAGDASEAEILSTFLNAVGQHRPQLVGFNSIDSDLQIMVQRAVILGLQAARFAQRPNKPWEGIDYFARGSDWNVDLKQLLGSWGKTVPSLHELAVQSGIPGKLDVDGNQVARLWLSGLQREIVRYNEFDAVTTYLLWLRVAHFSGHFSEGEYAEEQQRVRDLLEENARSESGAHFGKYLKEWDRLEAIVASR